MSVAVGTSAHKQVEDNIWEDLGLYKPYTYRGRAFLTHKDGSVSTVIRFKGINSTNFSEEKFVALFSKLQRTIEQVESKDLTIQFNYIRSANAKATTNLNLPNYLAVRLEKFNEMCDNSEIFDDEFSVGIYVTNPKRKGGASIVEFIRNIARTTSSEKKSLFMSAADGIVDRLELAYTTIDLISSFFRQSSFQYSVFSDEEQLMNYLQKFTRPQKHKSGFLKIDHRSEQPSAALFSGVRVTEKNKQDFTLDGIVHRVYSLDRVPQDDYVYGRSLEVIQSIPAEFHYSVSFSMIPMAESQKVLQKKRFMTAISAESNNNAIVQDEFKNEAVNRATEEHIEFVKQRSLGAWVSCNLIVKMKDTYIEKLKKTGKTRKEIMIDLDQELLKNVFPSFGGSEWAVESLTTWNVFLRTIPGFACTQGLELKRTFVSAQNVPYLLNMWSLKDSTPHNGINHFIDERGSYLAFDAINRSKLVAWNWLVAGQTGTGKSVIMNAIMAMEYGMLSGKEGPVMCILDNSGANGSYEKQVRVRKGTVIKFSGFHKSKINILDLNPELSSPTPKKCSEIADVLHEVNPELNRDRLDLQVKDFYLMVIDKWGWNNVTDRELGTAFKEIFGIAMTPELRDLFRLKKGEVEPAGKALDLIMSFMNVVLSSSAKEMDGFKNYPEEEISALILEVYRRIEDRIPYLNDLYLMCREILAPRLESDNMEERSDAQTFLSKLHHWTRNGQNYFFDADTDVDLDNDTILVDLKGLEASPSLQMIYLLAFSEIFSNKLYFIKGRRKHIIRDEAWSLLSHPLARRYLVTDLRTARKNGFATWLLTQSPLDVFSPSPTDGEAIINNMTGFFLGRFGARKTAQDVAQILDMPEEVYKRAYADLDFMGQQKNKFTGKTSFSRFVLKMGSEYYILRNVLHPLEAITYSSSDDDYSIIEYYMRVIKRFTELEDCLQHISEDKHKGDKGLIEYLEELGQTKMANSLKNWDEQQRQDPF